MDIQNTLIQAIKQRKFINFIYKNDPIRKVSPHAIYISSAENKNLDAYHIDGYSESGNFPPWRNFKLSEMRNIEILSEQFEIAEGYKSDSPKYNNYIYKI